MSIDLEQYLIHPIEREVDDSEAKVDLIRSKDNPVMSFFYESCFYRHDYVLCDTEYALPYDELFCFINTEHENEKLGATLTMEINGEKFTTDKNCMIEIPAFVPRGHISITDLKTPVFSFVTGAGREHTSLPKELWRPQDALPIEDMVAYYTGELDSDDPHGERQKWVMVAVPGKTLKGEFVGSIRRFYKTDGWVYVNNAHIHGTPEILGYYGSDPWHPFELGGDFYQSLNGERLHFDKPTAVYIPSYVPHCPVVVDNIQMENGCFWHSTGISAGPINRKEHYDFKSFCVEDGKAKEIHLEEPW